jgi:anti-sigma-K factor RskA
LSSRAYGGNWNTVSQSRAAISAVIAALVVDIGVIPDNQRAGQLLVRGVE